MVWVCWKNIKINPIGDNRLKKSNNIIVSEKMFAKDCNILIFIP